jgi:hypothetical protein
LLVFAVSFTYRDGFTFLSIAFTSIMRIVGLAMEVSDTLQGMIHRYRYVLLALYSVSLLALLGLIAARTHFWYDESFTLLIASLPNGRAIWDALAHGAENQPPLHFWFVHLALPVSRTLELSARIPSILSFWLMTLCLYRTVAKETNTTYGFIAMLIPFTTPTVYFAYEARGYAPLLLFASASVLFWQMAKSGERRPWSVVLIFLTLTASAYSHYYGVLLYLPFILTELAAGLLKKRWDWPVLLAILFAGIALVPLAPIMLAVGRYTEMFADPPLTLVQNLYGRLFGLPGVILGLMTLAAGLLGSDRPSPPSPSGSRPIWASRAGTLFLLIFCLLPLAGFFLAKLATNAYADRYFVFTVVGFSIAVALMLYQRCRDHSWLAVCCLFAITLMATLELRRHYTEPGYRAGSSVSVDAAVESTRHAQEGTEPILLPGLFYLPVYHYSSPEVRPRLYFLDDEPTEHFSVAARRLAVVRPIAIMSLKELFEKYSRFYVYMPSLRMKRELRSRSMQMNYVDDDLCYVLPMPRSN